MNIAVCMKQVPAGSSGSIDPVTKRLKREGIESVINPYDAYALEEAILLREKFGGIVTALTMGPVKAEKILRDALALSADRAILLSDRKFGGSDTWSTSYILSEAVKKIGNIDLVICGKQAIDGDTAQVGPGIAAHLGWRQAAYVSKLYSEADIIIAERMNEQGSDRIVLDFPSVITVVKDINKPRLKTLKGMLEARKMNIDIWTFNDLECDESLTGLDGSPTRVVKTALPPARDTNIIRINEEASSASLKIIDFLKDKMIIEQPEEIEQEFEK